MIRIPLLAGAAASTALAADQFACHVAGKAELLGDLGFGALVAAMICALVILKGYKP